jgi:hypothetical protein
MPYLTIIKSQKKIFNVASDPSATNLDRSRHRGMKGCYVHAGSGSRLECPLSASEYRETSPYAQLGSLVDARTRDIMINWAVETTKDVVDGLRWIAMGGRGQDVKISLIA